jgi:hypothetical protein
MTKDEALKLALEALKQIDEAMPFPVAKLAQAAIKEALAQPEQEPVVWMYQDKSTHDVRFQKHMRGFVDHGATYETPLYTSPPQQELVCVCGAVWEGQELIYTTPQRTWVGLPESAFAGMTLQQVTAMKYAEQILKDQNT